MHELHLMRQVVTAVEARIAHESGSKPIRVRLRVNSRSHLFTHDLATLQTTFDLVARGTALEGAELELQPVPVDDRCLRCGQPGSSDSERETCAACGGPLEAGPDVPEVVVHEVVITA